MKFIAGVIVGLMISLGVNIVCYFGSGDEDDDRR